MMTKSYTYLDWEQGIDDIATILQDALGGNDADDPVMVIGQNVEVEDLSPDRDEDVIRLVDGIMTLEFALIKHVFSRANERSQNRDDEDGRGTSDPYEDVERQLLSPGLPDIHTLHPSNMGKER